MLSLWLSMALWAANPTHSSTITLDLNQAPATALVELPGIGPKKALAIVARRTQRPFRSLEELRQIRGIGKKTLDRLRPRLRIGPATPNPPRSSPRPRRPTD